MAFYDPSKCAMCLSTFVKGEHGYNRTRLSVLTSPGTAYRLCQRTVYMDNFICGPCTKILYERTVSSKKGESDGKKRTLRREYTRSLDFSSENKNTEANGVEASTKPTQSTDSQPTSSKKRARFQTPRKAANDEGESTREDHTYHRNDKEMETESCEDLLSDVEDPEDDAVASDSVPEDDVETESEISDSDSDSGKATSQGKTVLPIKRAVALFADYRYLLGMRALLKVSPSVKKAFITVLVDMIRKEMKQKPKLKAFEQDVNQSTVSLFSWDAAMEEASQIIPVVVNCLWAMLPLKKNGKNKSALSLKAGQMLAIALYARNKKRYKFVQASMGIELYRQGVSRKVFSTLQRIGISQSVYAVRPQVDIIGKEQDKKLLTQKESQRPRKKPQRTSTKQCKMSFRPLKIYFCGSIRGGRQDAKLYARIIRQLEQYGKVLTEHVGYKDVAVTTKTDVEIYEQDMAWLEDCDAVVAEVTQTSMGVGFELGRAVAWNKRVLCLFRPGDGRRLSAMVRGAHDGKNFVVKDYKEEDVPALFKEFFGY